MVVQPLEMIDEFLASEVRNCSDLMAKRNLQKFRRFERELMVFSILIGIAIVKAVW